MVTLPHHCLFSFFFFPVVGFYMFIGASDREGGPLPVNRGAHSLFSHSKLGPRGILGWLAYCHHLRGALGGLVDHDGVISVGAEWGQNSRAPF